MNKFSNFLINENKNYLGHKVGDILTSMQELQDDMGNMGSRHLGKVAESIVNEIRKILHGSWEQRNNKYLKELQKVAVALQKTIDVKGDLKEILPAAVQNMQTLSGKLGIKVNDLEAPELEQGGDPISQDDFEETGDGPAEPQVEMDPTQMQVPPQEDPNMPQPTDQMMPPG